MILLHFTALGDPAPQGSKRHVGKGKMIEASKRVGPWREVVKAAGEKRMKALFVPVIQDPVALQLNFYLKRPKTHFGTGNNADILKDSAPRYHLQTPDLDKLIRAVGDALTGTVYADDKQITTIDARKQWTQGKARVEVIVFRP